MFRHLDDGVRVLFVPIMGLKVACLAKSVGACVDFNRRHRHDSGFFGSIVVWLSRTRYNADGVMVCGARLIDAYHDGSLLDETGYY